MGTSHTKGAAVRSFLRWYEQSHGREPLQRALQKIAPEHRPLLFEDREALGILPSVWYPSELIHDLVDALTTRLSEPELDRLAHEGGRAIVKDGLKSVYRMLFHLLVTPERYARNSDRIWRMFHDSGTNQVTVLGPNEQRVRIQGWRGHHPFVCRLNRASTALLYGEMKCDNVKLSDEVCITQGHGACSFRVSWE